MKTTYTYTSLRNDVVSTQSTQEVVFADEFEQTGSLLVSWACVKRTRPSHSKNTPRNFQNVGGAAKLLSAP